jgi:hypothetical protein
MGILTKEQIVGDLLIEEQITAEEAITLLAGNCKCRPVTREDFIWTSNHTGNSGHAATTDK